MVLTLRLFSARRRQKNPAETSFNSRGGYAKWGILGQLLRAALAPHCEPCGSKKSHLDLAALSPRAWSSNCARPTGWPAPAFCRWSCHLLGYFGFEFGH
jgi:hypothetical protein